MELVCCVLSGVNYDVCYDSAGPNITDTLTNFDTQSIAALQDQPFFTTTNNILPVTKRYNSCRPTRDFDTQQQQQQQLKEQLGQQMQLLDQQFQDSRGISYDDSLLDYNSVATFRQGNTEYQEHIPDIRWMASQASLVTDIPSMVASSDQLVGVSVPECEMVDTFNRVYVDLTAASVYRPSSDQQFSNCTSCSLDQNTSSSPVDWQSVMTSSAACYFDWKTLVATASIDDLFEDISSKTLTTLTSAGRDHRELTPDVSSLRRPMTSSISEHETRHSGKLSDTSPTSSTRRSPTGKTDKSLRTSFHERPPATYTEIIARIMLTRDKLRILSSEVYDTLMSEYPYFEASCPGDWRKQVRHELSSAPYFIKDGTRTPRGFHWTIHPACVDLFRSGNFCRRTARHAVQMYERRTTSGDHSKRLTTSNNRSQTAQAS